MITAVSESEPSVGLQSVALVGNPNAGKTSLFNALTGAFQKVANYPGVTVEKVSSTVTLGDRRVEFVDVPGLYSIHPISADEVVAAAAIRGEGGERSPDVLISVVDGSNLERNLYFLSEVLELGKPVVVVLTMTDTLPQLGLKLDVAKLREQLGVPVIPVVAHKGTGLSELRQEILMQLQAPKRPSRPLGAPDQSPTTEERYEWAAQVRESVLTPTQNRKRKTITDRIDGFLTHRVFGLLFFIAVMYCVFQSIYTLAGPLMDGINAGFDRIKEWVSPALEGSPIFQSFVVDGLVAGVGSVVVFLPQILILFFFIAALEGTGYLARAAFMMDRLLGWCGLSGRAFIPLLSSFACAIPGIMAARVMPDAKSRLATILVAPLMSCSARLPVYVLLIGAFIEPQYGAAWAGFALFAMHFVGLIVAIPVVVFLNKRVIRGKRLPFLLELPPYQWPKWRDVALAMYLRGKIFLQTAGTIIVLMSVLIWVTLYFPRSESDKAKFAAEYSQLAPEAKDGVTLETYLEERQVENSYLGRFGRVLEPAFAPAGFDWRIATAILAAFPARETVVPSLGIIFSLGGGVDEESKDLRSQIAHARWPDGRPLFTVWTAAGLMVFFALCCQCMSTLATVRRETNSYKWPVFMFLYMTVLAYVAAIAINQIGLRV